MFPINSIKLNYQNQALDNNHTDVPHQRLLQKQASICNIKSATSNHFTAYADNKKVREKLENYFQM